MDEDGKARDIPIERHRIRCLDLTRSITRAGRAPTGIDRVERAYLDQLLSLDTPLFALVRTAFGYLLLDKAAIAQTRDRLKNNDWPAADFLSQTRNRRDPVRQRAESFVRSQALARCRKSGLAKMVRAHIPKAASYINVGHSNLERDVFEAFSHTQTTVLVHDTIPLDYPEYQRPGAPEKFADKLRTTAKYADLILCNSQQTQRDVLRHSGVWDEKPETRIAFLGVIEPKTAGGTWPGDIDRARPVFVAAGTIEPRKNHALLLDIWEELAAETPPDEMPQLVIAGARGWNNAAVFNRLDRKPAAVFELNDLRDPDFFTLIEGATALLQPSFAEGFGLPPAEAILLGTPVICADLPIYGEILRDIPVYVDVNERYLWKKAVEELSRSQEHQTRKQANSTRNKLPTWDDHFKIVLSVA